MALLPVVGGGLVQLNKLWSFGARSSDTLLGFETTGPAVHLRWWVLPAVSPGSVGFCGERCLLLLHLWWWGVVFDLWIVVASI